VSFTAAAAGRLSIVATPIGNLEDITLRALRTLREADLILAEDTRRTRVLCQQHGIATALRAFHAHSGEAAIERAVAEIAGGKHVALVSDAGTPLLSDPGASLVAAAYRAGLRVEALPGASALTTALCVAGIPIDSFRFLGFLPRSGRRRREALAELAADRSASVIFEAPPRLATTLQDLAQCLEPERELAVCRELTKLHEEVARGTAAELAERFREGTRGELTLVVAGRSAASPAPDALSDEELDQRALALLAEGASVRDAAQQLATETGLRRQALYARVQALKQAGAEAGEREDD
jgi:16S rRNA (cytidine1402-2'-O)-methyltransferase